MTCPNDDDVDWTSGLCMFFELGTSVVAKLNPCQMQMQCLKVEVKPSCVWPEYLISAWLCNSRELRMLFKYKEVPPTRALWIHEFCLFPSPPTHTCHGFIWKGRQSNNTKSIVGIVTAAFIVLFTSTNPQRVDGYEGGIYWLTTVTRCERRHRPPPLAECSRRRLDKKHLVVATFPLCVCTLSTPVDHIAIGQYFIGKLFSGQVQEWVRWTVRWTDSVAKREKEQQRMCHKMYNYDKDKHNVIIVWASPPPSSTLAFATKCGRDWVK